MSPAHATSEAESILRDHVTAVIRLLAAARDQDDLPADAICKGLAAARALSTFAEDAIDEALIYAREISPHSGRARVTWTRLGEAVERDPAATQKRYRRLENIRPEEGAAS